MRSHDGYYDFEESDNIGYDGIEELRRMVREKQRQAKRRVHSRAEKARWDDDLPKYNDYDDNSDDDYNEEEFDRFSGVSFDHH